MDYKFSEIILNKNEIILIKKLKKQYLHIEDDSVIQTLSKYQLIQKVYDGIDHDFNLIFNGDFEITDFGKRYLIYLERINKNSFWEWVRYIITTLIAVSALFISLLKA